MRLLHPLPRAIEEIVTKQRANAVPSWVSELQKRPTGCSLPDRLSVGTELITSVPFYVDLSKVEASAVAGGEDPTIHGDAVFSLSPYHKMCHRVSFETYSIGEPYESMGARQLVVSALTRDPPLPGFLMGKTLEMEAKEALEKAAVGTTACDQPDFGPDSDDDAGYEPTSNPPRHATPTAAFASLIRRLRRSSPRVTTLSLPRILCGSVQGPEEDVSFQVTAEKIKIALEASKNSTSLKETTLYFTGAKYGPGNVLIPDPLVEPVMAGLVAAAPTWSNLTTLTLRQGTDAVDTAKLLNALSEGYEKRLNKAPIALKHVSCTVNVVTPELVIATARLATAASASLTSVSVSIPNPFNGHSTKISDIFNEESIASVRKMLVDATPPLDTNGKIEPMSFFVGSSMDEMRELMVKMVRGVTLSRPIKLAMPASPPQLRRDKKSIVDASSIRALLDAFIENNGLLTFAESVLSIPMHFAAAIARLLRQSRDRTPAYGLTEDEMQWFAQALVEEQRDGTIFPPQFLLDSPIPGEALLALDRSMEVYIPMHRSFHRAAHPTVGDMMDTVLPLATTDIPMFVGEVELGRDLASLSSREAKDDSTPPPNTVGDLLQRLPTDGNLSLYSPMEQMRTELGSGLQRCISHRQQCYLPGQIDAWLNEADLWYGGGRGGNLACEVDAMTPIGVFKAFRRHELARAHYWMQVPHAKSDQIPEQCAQTLASGHAFAVEFAVHQNQDQNQNQNQKQQGLLVAKSAYLIHDDDEGAAMQWVQQRMAEEALPTPPAQSAVVKPVLQCYGSQINPLAAYHAPSVSSSAPSLSGDTRGRVLVYKAVDQALIVQDMQGNTRFVLKKSTNPAPVAKTSKKSAEKVPAAPSSPVIIDGICVLIWGQELLVYDLWAAESSTGGAPDASPTEALVFPHDSCPSGGYQSMAWCGDDVIFVTGSAGKKKRNVERIRIERSMTSPPRATGAASRTIKLNPLDATSVFELNRESEATYVVQAMCTPNTLVVVTIANIHIYSRSCSTSSAAASLTPGGDSGVVFLRVLPFNSMKGVKLFPGSVFGGNEANKATNGDGAGVARDVVAYIVSPKREGGFGGNTGVKGGWFRFANAHSDETVFQLAGVVHQGGICVGAFPYRTLGNDCSSGGGGGSSAIEGAKHQLNCVAVVSVWKQLICWQVCAEDSTGVKTVSKDQLRAPETCIGGVDFQVSSVVKESPGAEFEKMRKSVRDAVSNFSSKKGGRITKVLEIITGFPEGKLRSEASTYAFYVACHQHLPDLALKLLELMCGVKTHDDTKKDKLIAECDVVALPPPLWMLQHSNAGTYFSSLDTFAMDENTISAGSKPLRDAVRAFLNTTLGVAVCLVPEVAVGVLEALAELSRRANSSSTTAAAVAQEVPQVSNVMLISVIAFGFGIGGNLVHLSMGSILPNTPSKEVVTRMFQLLLDGCGDEKLMTLEPAVLKSVAQRCGFINLKEHALRVTELVAKQEVFNAMPLNAAVMDVEEKKATADWLAHVDLLQKVTTFGESLVGNFDQVQAESRLEALLALIPPAEVDAAGGPPKPRAPVLVTEAMRRVAARSRAPKAKGIGLKSNPNCPPPAGGVTATTDIGGNMHKNQAKHQWSVIANDSLMRDYPPTLLGEACSGERVEREGEEDLPAYLSLKGRLIVRLMEAGADVNRMSLMKTQYGGATVRLPIDCLFSPTLISLMLSTAERLRIRMDFKRSTILSGLMGGNWTGCRLFASNVAHGSTMDMYAPRYELLPRILSMDTKFEASSVEKAIEVARTSRSQTLAHIAHQKLTGQNYGGGNIQSCTLKYAEFALPLLEAKLAEIQNL